MGCSSRRSLKEKSKKYRIKIRRKCINDWISTRDWENWIHEEFTDKQIAQLGL